MFRFIFNLYKENFQKLLFIGAIILALIILPLVIKAAFWILLQIFNYPLHSILILILIICSISLYPRLR